MCKIRIWIRGSKGSGIRVAGGEIRVIYIHSCLSYRPLNGKKLKELYPLKIMFSEVSCSLTWSSSFRRLWICVSYCSFSTCLVWCKPWRRSVRSTISSAIKIKIYKKIYYIHTFINTYINTFLTKVLVCLPYRWTRFHVTYTGYAHFCVSLRAVTKNER